MVFRDHHPSLLDWGGHHTRTISIRIPGKPLYRPFWGPELEESFINDVIGCRAWVLFIFVMLTDDSGFDLLIIVVWTWVSIFGQVFWGWGRWFTGLQIRASMTEPSELPASAPVDKGVKRARLVTYMVAEGIVYCFSSCLELPAFSRRWSTGRGKWYIGCGGAILTGYFYTGGWRKGQGQRRSGAPYIAR